MRNDEPNQPLAGQTTAQLCQTPAEKWTVSAESQVASPDDQKKYVDKFGRFHTDAILSAWSAAMRKAMGIRPLKTDIDRSRPSPSRVD